MTKVVTDNLQVSELRALAKDCLRTDRSTEAFLHLSHALRSVTHPSSPGDNLAPALVYLCRTTHQTNLRLDEDNREVLLERSRVCRYSLSTLSNTASQVETSVSTTSP